MRDVSLWEGVLGVEKTVIERVDFDADAEIVIAHGFILVATVAAFGLRARGGIGGSDVITARSRSGPAEY